MISVKTNKINTVSFRAYLVTIFKAIFIDVRQSTTVELHLTECRPLTHIMLNNLLKSFVGTFLVRDRGVFMVCTNISPLKKSLMGEKL